MQLDESGRYLACGTADRKVKIFDIHSNKITHEFVGHKLSVNLIKWMPNTTAKQDKLIVFSAAEDGKIMAWDLVLNA